MCDRGLVLGEALNLWIPAEQIIFDWQSGCSFGVRICAPEEQIQAASPFFIGGTGCGESQDGGGTGGIFAGRGIFSGGTGGWRWLEDRPVGEEKDAGGLLSGTVPREGGKTADCRWIRRRVLSYLEIVKQKQMKSVRMEFRVNADR